MAGNKLVLTICPHCGGDRLVRSDVIKRVTDAGKPLICKPCHNRIRLKGKESLRKGTGIKNDPLRIGAYRSWERAKQRVRLGAAHHPAYAAVEFRFASFDEFFAEVGPRPDGCTLDRIDPLGHYEPGNVRWATKIEQARNRMPRGYWTTKAESPHSVVE